MGRFLVLVALLLFVGSAVLMLFAPDYVGSLVFFVIGLLLLALILKVFVDFYLHFKGEEAEELAEGMVDFPKTRVFHNLEEYNDARRREMEQIERRRK